MQPSGATVSVSAIDRAKSTLDLSDDDVNKRLALVHVQPASAARQQTPFDANAILQPEQTHPISASMIRSVHRLS